MWVLLPGAGSAWERAVTGKREARRGTTRTPEIELSLAQRCALSIETALRCPQRLVYVYGLVYERSQRLRTIGGRANAEKATEGKMEETLETVGKGKRLGWMEHMLAWARVVARLPQADGGWGFGAAA